MARATERLDALARVACARPSRTSTGDATTEEDEQAVGDRQIDGCIESAVARCLGVCRRPRVRGAAGRLRNARQDALHAPRERISKSRDYTRSGSRTARRPPEAEDRKHDERSSGRTPSGRPWHLRRSAARQQGSGVGSEYRKHALISPTNSVNRIPDGHLRSVALVWLSSGG